jgi:hypothetical protein
MMGDRQQGQSGQQGQRGQQGKRLYLAMMALCLGLFLVAWLVVSRYSVVAAFVMSAVAALIPPAAAIVANTQRNQ